MWISLHSVQPVTLAVLPPILRPAQGSWPGAVGVYIPEGRGGLLGGGAQETCPVPELSQCWL